MHMDWTGQDCGISRDGGMSNGHPTPHGCPMDVPWTSRGCPMDRWTGQDSGTGCPVDVHSTGGLDRTVGQAWSVREGCPMDVPWMSIGQVDWTGQWDKPGQ